MTDLKPYRHRFPMTIIQHAVWLYHRFPLNYQDVQELLHQRGIEVSHETLREWCIKFGSLFAEDLRHREPRRGSRWHLDEMHVVVGGVAHWLWRNTTNTEPCSSYSSSGTETLRRRRHSFNYDVPETVCTGKLWGSYP